MSDFIPWLGAVAIGCAAGAVLIAAKQAICEIIPSPEPALKPAAPDQWRIVSEGVLALEGTSYEIRVEPANLAFGAFRIYHRGRSVDLELRLEKAKQTTLRHMREMIEIGVEP
jgi:hypothetical protein